jgi:hypothetical protein
MHLGHEHEARRRARSRDLLHRHGVGDVRVRGAAEALGEDQTAELCLCQRLDPRVGELVALVDLRGERGDHGCGDLTGAPPDLHLAGAER